jgi:hypothetical protein
MADDYREYQANEVQGGKDQTKFQVTNRLAPAKNWATQIAKTQAYDNTLLTENNAKTQVPADELYPITHGTNTTAPATPVFNGFNWGGIWTY